MIHPVIDGDFRKIKRAYTDQACSVDAELIRIRPPLVMRVNTAFRAKVVLGGVRVELVKPECLLTRNDTEFFKGRRNDNCSPHSAI